MITVKTGGNILIGIFLLTSILITTIVYSAFSTQLQIKGDAIVRSDNDIRITSVRILSQTNNAYETYNNKYTKDTTSMFVTLPASSSITYVVEISNKVNINSYIENIVQQSHTNSNVNIDISLNQYDRISANFVKTFTITLTNNTSTEQIETLVYKYSFMQDGVEPILSLSKETYIEQDLTTWNNNGTTIDNGIMTIPDTTSYITSSYINVNGGFWYLTLDAYSENADDNGYGKVYWSTTYYDNSYQKVNTLQELPGNGWGTIFPINQWNYNLDWYKVNGYNRESQPRYGPNVKYITVYFENWNDKTVPIQIKNVKIHGEAIPNSFYNINITSSDNEGVVTTKYAKGNYTSDYFKNNGTVVTSNQIRVEENGIYTVYVSDIAGNETIQTIEITNIE